MEGVGAWRALATCVITIILAAGSRTSLAAFLRPIEADLHLDRAVRDRYGVRAVGVLMGSVGLAHQVGGSLCLAAGGFSVAELGGYAPAVVLVTLVVLIGGLAQLGIPPARAFLPAH